MAKRKWKGKLTKNIRNYGDALAGKEYTFKKGQEVIVWKIKAKAIKTGDARIKIKMSSDLLKIPVTEEESTHVY